MCIRDRLTLEGNLTEVLSYHLNVLLKGNLSVEQDPALWGTLHCVDNGGVFLALSESCFHKGLILSLIHISEPTRLLSISYAVFCLKKKTNHINVNAISIY
eukprot:TRINITY_DN35505_c0_g1_i1.p1 TRINITY_DN35505_c0_g1~~TRINITY_DN35505_c0_g1_i1.p1  ORF type:complete len:101 (+),score=15.30 TRINITY_DN35505_c0_g1_i1:84-386(+)